MTLKCSLLAAIAAGSVLFPVALPASPVVQVDTAEFDAGILQEATTTIIKHTFLIKNPGDSLLVISEVRPSCGCTTVGFDSIIPPGKTGHVTVEVNTENFKEGAFEKIVTVISNANKYSPYRLHIKGVKLNIIITEPASAKFNAGKGRDTGATILLKTDRKNFSVTSVIFHPRQDTNEPLNWQSAIPMSFSLTRMPDTVEAEPAVSGKTAPVEPRRSIYKLQIPYSLKGGNTLYGQLTVTTNIPEKPELKINAEIEPVKP